MTISLVANSGKEEMCSVYNLQVCSMQVCVCVCMCVVVVVVEVCSVTIWLEK